MMQLVFIFAFIACAFAKVPIKLEDDPVIKTDVGSLLGTVISSESFEDYYGFKGIPYAEPPVGDLRFRAPVPHLGWDDVRNATEHGNVCPQIGLTGLYEGDEDCLFLNVYSRDLNDSRPVIFWIHGGAFLSGSGNSDIHGPEFLLDDGVVVVTINYRLGALGFLTTSDKNAPGNYGMKDIVAALKWVQRNIAKFGGDPNSVTISGQSSGGAAVQLLVLSRMANGLFHKAISQSGVALNIWAMGSYPSSYRWTASVATNVGIIHASTTYELILQLRWSTAEEIVKASPVWIDQDLPRGWSHIPFVPQVDPEDTLEPIFLHDTPRRIIESGDYNHVPYIIGYVDAEAQYTYFDQTNDNNTFPFINENTTTLIPKFWNVPVPSEAADTIATELTEKYFAGKPLSDSNRLEYTVLATDQHFIVENDEAVRLHSQTMNESVYYYVFTFVGDLNLYKIILGLTEYPGAIHGDDLSYLFRMDANPQIEDTNPAALTRLRFVRLWTNFAKFGNPTPVLDSEIIGVEWQPVNGNQEYLEIGNELLQGTHPTLDRISFWNDLRNRYANVTD